MNPACIAEIAQAIGRNPTRADLEAFQGGLTQQMRELARRDRTAWQSMSHEQRLQAAADAAAREAVASADKAAQRKASNLLAQSRETQRLTNRAAQKAEQGSTQAFHDALFERLVQVDTYVSGLRNEALSDMLDAINAVEGRFLNLMDDPAKVQAFAKAVLDGDTSDPAMAKAAKAYIDTMEALRNRANAAGADIGKLDYAYLPQPHDTGKIARTGVDQWVADVLPRLDRERYVAADGSLMTDDQVAELLRGAWTTLATEGRSKMDPGAARGGSRASRFDDAHRAIHFKDADSYIAYMQQYGRGSMLEAIAGHVGSMTKTIGMLEELGANPATTWRLLKDTAELRDNRTGARNFGATLDMYWDSLNGTTGQPVSQRLAQVGQSIRSFTVAAKLQGTLISSITDAPLQVLVAKSSGVPMGKAMKSLFAGVGKDSTRVAHELALGIDEIAGELSRWHDGNLGATWASKLASSTMKLSLMEGWTNALRRGFALTYSGTLQRMARTDWAGLNEGDRRRLTESGVTEADWRIWQLAAPQEFKGVPLLTKEGIRAIDAEANGLTPADIDRAVARFLGHVDAEAKTAVLAPDLRTRAALQQGTKAGTVGGEGLRMLMLFKSFPLAVVEKHLRRIRNIPSTQGKVAYSVAMMTSLTLFGAIALQLKDIIAGKDPRDMTTGKFWAAAFLQGGGLGIFGDVLYTGMGGNTRGGQANWTSLAGPVFGTVLDAVDLTLGNAGRALAGKETQFGADAVRFAKGNTPFINLWYARGAIDHMVMHDLQESVSPGYLKRMKARARKDWGQRYWWEPGEAMPDRAPDLEAATGD
jgi:hypothetical protein